MRYPNDDWWNEAVKNVCLVSLGFSLGLLAGESKSAPLTVGVHVGTIHLQPEVAYIDGGNRGYNDFNPGLYVRYGSWQVGGYKNSHREPSFYGAYTYEHLLTPNLGVGGALGAVTGYPLGDVVPLIAISARYRAIRLSFTPQMGDKNSASIHLMLEHRL